MVTMPDGTSLDDTNACRCQKLYIYGSAVTAKYGGEIILGDVDKNGDIEVTDATWIQGYVAKMEIPYKVGELTV